MEKKMRFLIAGISFILAISLLLPVTIASASPEKANRPDKDKPVQAQDVHIVRKVSERPGPPIKPPGKDKPGKNDGAATGILGTSVSGERYAIVIGISDYPGLDYDLNYCDDDAIDISNILTNVYEFAPENVTLLVDGDATRSAILTAIEDIPADADEVVFSFSGHGGYGEASDTDDEIVDEFIVAHNGVDLMPIWDGELRLAFSGISVRAVFLFDSCNAGGMTDLAGKDRVICMAASETGLSYEYGTLQNGQFTYYFAEEGVLQGYADSYDHDSDGDVAKKRNPGEPDDVVIEEAFDYANKKCKRQSPVISDSFENDLLP